MIFTLAFFAFATLFASAEPVSIPLYHNPHALSRRSVPLLQKRGTGAVDVPWVTSAREHLRRKYGAEGRENGLSLLEKRQQLGDLELGNAFSDALYYAPITVGTPGRPFNLIADTGSSDLWIAGAQCVASGSCPSSAPTYDPSSSSSSQSTDTAFSIAYGSGNATGTMVSDTVVMGGYYKENVLFAVANESSAVLRNDLALSGIAGFGWASIATSGTTPLWELLAEGGTIPAKKTFSFALTRATGAIAQNKAAPNIPSSRLRRKKRGTMLGMPTESSEIAAATAGEEPSTKNAVYGGTLTLGGVNQSLFQGRINMVNLTTKGFWLVPMEGVSVNGQQTNVAAVTNVAIDTGTSLVAAPAAACASIYGRIAGSQPSSDPNFQGYWEFPCDAANTEVALQFNGVQYPMDPKDFNLGRVSDGMCLGSVFELDLAADNTTRPSWIIGDAWLKNVYSVYQFDPPAVGFAQLSANWNSENGGSGSNAPQSTLSNTSQSSQNTMQGSGSSSLDMRWGATVAATAALLAMMWM